MSRSTLSSLRAGEKRKVFVTNASENGHLFVQLDTEDAYSLPDLVSRLQADLHGGPRQSSYEPRPGDICASLYSETNEWYRAKVLSVRSGQADVFYVDYGNRELRPFRCLKPLDGKYLALGFQAVECVFRGFSPVGGRLDRNGAAEFAKHFQEKEISVNVCSVADVAEIELEDATHLKRLTEKGLFQRALKEVPLVAGKSYNVFVSHVINPGKFWIQLSSHGDRIDSLSQDLNRKTGTDISLSSIKTGLHCCAKYWKDHSWYRAEVMSAPENKEANVLFVDFGNEETVPVHDIHLMDPSFLDLPVLATKCRLSGVQPTSQSWSSASITTFESSVIDVPLRCSVIQSGSITEVSVSSSGQSVANILINKNLAKCTQKFKDITSQLRVGQEYPLLISFLENPQQFWCQLAANAKSMEALTEQLQDAYQSGRAPSAMLKLGTACVAKFAADDTWYRAVVEQENPLRVLFVDFGNSDDVRHEVVKEIRPEFLSLPAQAFCCHLKGVAAEKKVQFEELVSERDITGTVLDINAVTKEIVVDLNVQINGSFTSIGSALQDIQIKGTSFQQNDFTIAEVTVATKDHFWCRSLEDEEKLLQLGESLTRQCNSGKLKMLQRAKGGMLCAARFSEDGKWYRARLGATKGQVYFIDYGNEEGGVSLKDLKELTPEFTELPSQAMKCRLFHFQNGFPREVEQLFKALTQEKELHAVLIKKVPDFHIVSLIDNNTDENINIGEELQWSQQKVAVTPLQVGQKCQVAMVQVKSPDDMWCQIIDGSLEKLMLEISDAYQDLKEDSTSFAKKAKAGRICCARFTEDDSWYRAEVIQVKRAMQVEVRYIDFGNSEVISVDRVRPLKEPLFRKPRLAFAAELAGVNQRGPAVTAKLERLTKDQEMMCSIVAMKGKKAVIKLEDLAAKRDIADELNQRPEQKRKEATPPVSSPKQTEAPYSSLTLKKGQVQQWTISYIRMPDEFWCQTQNGVKLLEDLQSHIQSFYTRLTNPKAKFTDVELNSACSAQSLADDVWYRGMIVSGDTANVDIHYVDYGNEESLPLSRLRRLHKDYKSVPAQAFCCCLDGCPVPRDSNGWQASDQAAFDAVAARCDYAVKGEMKAFLREKDRYVVDLSFMEGGQRRSFKSEFLSRRKGGGGGGLSPSKGPARPSPVALKVKMTPPAWEAGKTDTICVVGVLRVDNIWCQFVKSRPELEKMSQEIARFCEKMPQPLQVPVFKEGSFCLARYVSDGKYYRAKVQSVEAGGKQVTARYIDFGNTEVMDAADLRPITLEFCQHPAMAFVCKLSGVEPVDDSAEKSEWSKEASAFLERVVIGKKLAARRVISDGSAIAVELYDTSTGKEVSIASELIKAKQAKRVRPSQGPSLVNPGLSKAGIRPAYVLPGHCYDIQVTFIESPKQFYCFFTSENRDFRYLTDDIRRHCEHGATRLTDPQPGDCCCARFSTDGQWYRAAIREIQSEAAEVQFVDYGNLDVVPFADLRTLKPDMASLRAQCFEATLDVAKTEFSSQEIEKFIETVLDKKFSCRVIYRDGDGIVTAQLLDFKTGKNVALDLGFKPSSSPSRLAPGASPASRLSFRCLTFDAGQDIRVIVTACDAKGQFWCQPVAGAAEIESVMEELHDVYSLLSSGEEPFDGPADVGCICCAKYSVDEQWYRAEVVSCGDATVTVRYIDYGNTEDIPLKELKALRPRFIRLPKQAAKCSVGEMTQETEEEFRKAVLDQEMDIVIKKMKEPGEFEVEVPSLLPPPPSAEKIRLGQLALDVGSRLGVYVVQANAPDDVWLQSVSHVSDLETLMQELNERHAAQTPSSARSWSVGEFCCTKYSDDENWYRAIVLEVQTSGVEVRFVDYGNKEVVPVADVRELDEKFCVLPQATFRCKVLGFNSSEQRSLLTDTEELTCLVKAKAANTDPQVELLNEKSANILEPVVAKEISVMKLPENDTFSAYVTHIISAVECYIQPMFGEEDLNVVMEELAKDSDSPIPSTSLKDGDVCCAQYSVDQCWYRARILRATETDATVLFVDYGNEETVKRTNIKALEAVLAKLPAQAVHCELAGVQVSESNAAAAKDLFEAIVKDKDVTVEVVKDMKVKIFLPESKQSVANELINQGMAQSTESDSKRPVEEMKSFTSVSPSVGNSLEVYTSFVENAGFFYCQLTSSGDKLASLMDSLTEIDDASVPAVVNSACCTRYSEDGALYRAKVVEISGDDATVQFVDYGNSETVPAKDLRRLDAKFCALPAQALHCRLAGVPSKAVNITARFQEATADRKLRIKVVSVLPNEVYEVQVFDGETGENIREKLVAEAGLTAKSQPETSQSELTEKERIESAETVDSSDEQESDACDPLPSIPVAVGDSLNVYMSHLEDPDCFYCQPSDSADDLSSLMEDLAKIADISVPAVVGQACCARYSEDGGMYRAKVTEISGDKATVQFVDYGNSETVPAKDLRRLDDKFRAFSAQALRCCLADVVPPPVDDDGSWSETARAILEEAMTEQLLRIDVVSKQPNNVYEVRVFDSETGENIGEKLVSEGSAVDERAEASGGSAPDVVKDCNVVREAGKATSVEKKLVRITEPSNVCDEQNIPLESAVEPEECKEVRQDEEGLRNGTVTKTADCNDESVFGVAKGLVSSVLDNAVKEVEENVERTVQQLLDSVVNAALVDTEGLVEMKVTSIKDGGHFWAQIDSQKSLIDLADEMAEEYGDFPTERCSDSVAMGDVCAVANESEGAWQRGRIDSDPDGDNSYDVFFVDTGVRQLVPAMFVQPLKEKYTELSHQATFCVLNGLEPYQGNEWALEVKLFLEEILRMTPLYGRLLPTPDEHEGGCPVELFLDADRAKTFQLSSLHLPLIHRSADGYDTPSEIESIQCEVGSMHEAQEVAAMLSGPDGTDLSQSVIEEGVDGAEHEEDRLGVDVPVISVTGSESVKVGSRGYISVGSLLVDKRYAKLKS